MLAALGFLMWVAYRGASVIIFAPIAALLAVALSAPIEVLPAFSALFLERLADFLKSYFVVFLLGALFGKLIELSGFARARSDSGSTASSNCPARIRRRATW